MKWTFKLCYSWLRIMFAPFMTKIVLCIITFVIVLNGCTSKTLVKDILNKPFSEWTSGDCRIIIAHCTSHNFQSESRIIAIATPLVPAVLKALVGYQMKRSRQLPEDFIFYFDDLTSSLTGLYLDYTTGKYIDRSGNFYNWNIRQLDSIFL